MSPEEMVRLSEDHLALELADEMQNKLRYVPAWGRWRTFDGTCWRDDDRLKAFDAARRVCRAAASNENSADRARRLASAKTRAAVVDLARSDQRLVATVDQWDADPWLLNTPGGVVDLRTGGARTQRPEDYLSKITSVAPGGGCPTFLQFLHRVTGGDRDYIAYMRRAFGYCLTGLTTEDALFFLHGSGANGKSTLLRVMRTIFGDYAMSSPSSVFTAKAFQSHPTEIARMHGKRLVVASEIESGEVWAEARIKELTGGDEVSARLMRQDFFDFTPQLKLVIAGNHTPGLSDISEAFRRRFHLWPFAITIPAAERDKNLESKLLAEGGGILQWAIEGCLEWQQFGLQRPDAVATATTEYLDDQDKVALWIAARCVLSPGAEELLISVAHKAYNDWALEHGGELLKRNQFKERMARIDYPTREVRAGVVLPGLALGPF